MITTPNDKPTTAARVPAYLNPDYLKELAKGFEPLKDREQFGMKGIRPFKGYIIFDPLALDPQKNVLMQSVNWETEYRSKPYTPLYGTLPEDNNPQKHPFAIASLTKLAVLTPLVSLHVDALARQYAKNNNMPWHEKLGNDEARKVILNTKIDIPQKVIDASKAEAAAASRKGQYKAYLWQGMTYAQLLQLSLIESNNYAAQVLGDKIGQYQIDKYRNEISSENLKELRPSGVYAAYANYLLREKCGVEHTFITNASGLPHVQEYAGINVPDQDGKTRWNLQQTTPSDLGAIVAGLSGEISAPIMDIIRINIVDKERMVHKDASGNHIVFETSSKNFREIALGKNISWAANINVTPKAYKTGNVGNFYNGMVIQSFQKNGDELVAVTILGNYHDMGNGHGKDDRARAWREQAAAGILQGEIPTAVETAFNTIMRQRVIAAVSDSIKSHIELRPAGLLDIRLPPFIQNIFNSNTPQTPERE